MTAWRWLLGLGRALVVAGVIAAIASVIHLGEISVKHEEQMNSVRDRVAHLESGETTPMSRESRATFNALNEKLGEVTDAIKELRDGQMRMIEIMLDAQKDQRRSR